MSANFNYGEVLQKSFLFYEAQRSGDLPPDNRIAWRGDSALNDGATVGRDLSGGYYDAGDHVKFIFPMAGAMTMLGWGLSEYQAGYIQSNQYDEALDALKWGTDWLLKAHETDAQGTTAFWMQVGDGDDDHSVWIPPEALEDSGSPARPAFKLDRQTPGSDVAAEAAAALAAASIVFRPHDEAYADELLENAIQLYAFADDADLNPGNGKQRGKYSEALHQLAPSIFSSVDETTGELNYYGYYNSWSGYPDELLWGATWLHKAQAANGIADTQYLNLAEQQYQQTYFNAPWTHTWDDKSQGAGILLAQLTQKEIYKNDVEGWLNRWLPPSSPNRPANGVAYSSGGLAWLTTWGSLRASANTAFLAGIYADTVADPNGEYSQFAQQQIDYALGDNPQNFSYVVGFGNNYPLQPHHRGASGITSYGSDFNNPNLPNEYVLYGALVGGPQSADDTDYNDLRTDFVTNEVALDYNAAFTGAVARLYQQFGGEPISDQELDNLVDNEGDVVYRPHLQVHTDDLGVQELAITHYGETSQNREASRINVFLDKGLQFIENGRRKVSVNYQITPETRIRFEAFSEGLGEIQGIGFDNNNVLNNSDMPYFFQVAGSQDWGIQNLEDYIIGQAGTFTQYDIPVGQFFTGQFTYLTFVNNYDVSNAISALQFRNIKLLEQALPPNQLPTTSGLANIVVSEGVNESIINLYGAFDDAETSDENLQYSLTANTNENLIADAVVTSEGNLILSYAPGEVGETSVTVTATDEAGTSVSTSFDVIVEETMKSGAVFMGDAGGDRITGTAANDCIDGLGGNDQLFGGRGDDDIKGGSGQDNLRGELGADRLDGGAGSDLADYVTSPASVQVDLSGGVGSGGHATGDLLLNIERLRGSRFDDQLLGDDGNNTLSGLAGNDSIFGRGGNDYLRGDAGADQLDGGAGRDFADYLNSPTRVVVSLATGLGTTGNAAGDQLTNIEDLRGSLFDDQLLGDAGNNRLWGASGNDVLFGDAGTDFLRGGLGGDTLNGGSGYDWADYARSTEAVDVSLSANTATGGEAEGDSLIDIERLQGSRFNDSLAGDNGPNTLIGGDGADQLVGHGGFDSLIGGSGNDSLEGGAGPDRFTYQTSTFGFDTILDFADGLDQINLRTAGLTFYSFTVSPAGTADTLLTLDDSNTILLVGIDESLITAADFLD